MSDWRPKLLALRDAMPRSMVVHYGTSMERIDLEDIFTIRSHKVEEQIRHVGHHTQRMSQLLAVIQREVSEQERQRDVMYAEYYDRIYRSQKHEDGATTKQVIEGKMYRVPVYRKKCQQLDDLEFQKQVIRGIIDALSQLSHHLSSLVRLKTQELTTYRQADV